MRVFTPLNFSLHILCEVLYLIPYYTYTHVFVQPHPPLSYYSLYKCKFNVLVALGLQAMQNPALFCRLC